MNPAEIAELCQSFSHADVDEPINLLSSNIKIIGERKLELCLVGKLCMNRMVNRDAFRMIIRRIWKLKQDVDIEVIGAIIFGLDGGTVVFRPCSLGAEEPTGIGELTKMRFHRVMFWIQIHNTPFLCMNKETCFFLGSLIGEVVEVDSSMAGHVLRDCLLTPVGGFKGEEDRKFGAWLRTNSPLKSRMGRGAVCMVAPLANLSKAEAVDQRHLGGLNGGVTSPDEVLLNDGGSGRMVGLENVNGGLAQRDKRTFRGRVLSMESMRSWCMSLLLTYVMFKRDKNTFRGQVLHGEHETVVHEPLVDKCDVQEGQKLLSWQSVVHGERSKVVAQTSVVQGGPETEMEQGLLMCSSKLGDSSGDHAKASKIQVGGAATGFPLPFRFSANTTFRESIDPDPGAFISMSPKKTELLEEVGTE
ncbi:hypothetical protein ACOSP7_004972 [Xanthoceras sorbifolium]